MTPYPILFSPTILEKVWGGRRLEKLGKHLPKPAARYGESWELADMSATSASGAGGGAVRSAIANGPLAGKTIHDALDLWGDALLHRAARTLDGSFPLLIKFLDASENLSVQVHPSPEYARTHAGAHLKTECWYILDADPGAQIYVGIKPGVSREEFSRLARANDPKIVDAMRAIPAVPGECHNLPSGTVHALGAGVLVAEVQTPSDTTFRLYDWGRTGRELHVEPALECASFDAPPAPKVLRSNTAHGETMLTDFFKLSQYRIDDRGMPAGVCAGEVFMVLRGQGVIESAALPEPIRIVAGHTGFIPAQIDADTRFRADAAHPLVVLFAQPTPNAKRLM